LAMVIVDEEHDQSFKQQEGFRYHARDLAILLGQLHKVPVILGSATPSFESLANAQQKKYTHLYLPNRAGSAVTPSFHLIDLRSLKLEQGLSAPLLKTMQQHLEQGNQVMVFLNRRGYAPVLMCPQCNWTAKCQRCDTHYTLHRGPRSLQCHHCGGSLKPPRECPACKQGHLFPLGQGTERIEHLLQEKFAKYPILRFDGDTTRKKGALHKLLQQVQEGGSQILVGTQILAKGHHFPQLTLVAIIDSDYGLFSPDFRAAEHLGQLIVQVAGRAGRAERPGQVLIQTRSPDHPWLQSLIHQGYAHFADLLLKERKAAHLPPFCYFALLRAEASDQQVSFSFLDAARKEAEILLAHKNLAVQILGPVAAPIEKRAGRFRSQLLVSAAHRQSLHLLLEPLAKKLEKLKSASKVRWALDIDPQDML